MSSDDLGSTHGAEKFVRDLPWLAVLRMVFGALFIASAALKLFPLEYFELILVDQVGASWKWVPWFSRGLVWFEFVIGSSILFGFQTKRALWVSLGLLTLFQIFLLHQIISGEGDADCGCFGELLPLDGPSSFAKNLGFMLIGGLLLFQINRASLWKLSWVAPLVIALAIPGLLLSRPIPEFDPNADFELDIELLERRPFEAASSLDEGNKTVVLMLATCVHCAQLSTLISQLDPVLVEDELRIIIVGQPGGVDYFIQETGIEGFEYVATVDRELIGAIGGTFPTVLYLQDGEVQKKWKGRDVNITLLTDLLQLD